MEKQFDLLVMIGRFRLLHNGQCSVIDKALTLAHNVLVLVGSANISRNSKGNEFTASEVRGMLRAQYPTSAEGSRLSIASISDFMYDEGDLEWIMGVQREVKTEINHLKYWQSTQNRLRVGLVGFSKDSTSYYLKKFPQWDSVNVDGYKHKGKIVSATDLRQEFFYGDKFGTQSIETLRDRVPQRVCQWLFDWATDNHEVLTNLRAEREFATKYADEHQFRGKLDSEGRPLGSKYDPTHATVDSVIIQSGHVLLIRRGHNPGKGKLALPGGFINPGEKPSAAMIREAKEETEIALSPVVLKLALKATHTFVAETPRGTFNKHVGLFVLNDRTVFPEINASDDAEPGSAVWHPLGELDPTQMTEDHYFLIMKMIKSRIGE